MRKLLLLFFLTILPLMAIADPVKIGGIYYNLDAAARTAQVTCGEISYEGDFVIPETVNSGGVDYIVTAIADDAFYKYVYTGSGYRTVMSHITSVTIPKSVISIRDAFRLSYELTSIVVAKDNKVYDSRNNCNAIIETATNKLIVGCVNSIIPSDVVIIGEHAFYRRGLTNLNLPEGLKEIEKYAFQGNAKLKSVTFPNTLTTLRDDCFSNCDLISIEIPASLSNLGTSVFEGNMNLERIVVAKGNQRYSSPNGCNAIVDTQLNAIVQGCNTTVIPEGITRLWLSSFNSTGIKKLLIPEGITDLGDYTFYDCDRLEEISIPSTTNFIGKVTFYDCVSLKKIYCYLNEPYALSTEYNGPFGCNGSEKDKVYQQATLYVPKGTKAKYKAAEIWSKFSQIEEMEDTNPEDKEGEGKVIVPDVDVLKIWMANGEVVSLALDEEPKTSYADGKLVIKTTAKTFTYPLENVRKFTYYMAKNFLLGDADGNGVVNNDDVIAVSNKILGKHSGRFVVENADMNGDNKVNAVDIVMIISMLKAQ